jgi:hypothetical protein
MALAVNVVAVNPQGLGNLKGWAGDISEPAHAAIVNYQALNPNLNVANAVIVSVRTSGALGSGHDIEIKANGASTEVVADVVGYFSSNSPNAGDADNDLFLGLGAGNPTQSTGSGSNTAIGAGSLGAMTDAADNTAIGSQSLSGNTTGSSNIAIGALAGQHIVAGSNNVDIGASPGLDESNTIRIGNGQTATFVAGIDGATSASGVAVFVNSNGQLGTATSSARYKQDVQDMGAASDVVLKLRPVRFYYRPQYDDGSQLLQYGLVAEEVAEVAPGLVQFGADGKPKAVRYHFVNAMLLDQVQRQHRIIEAREVRLKEQVAETAELRKLVLAQRAQINRAERAFRERCSLTKKNR